MMRSRFMRLLAAATSLLLLWAAPPASSQLDPRDRPTVTGPLGLGGKECNRQRFEAPNGRVRAVTRACIYAYTFDPDAETDAERNYGVLWLQTYAEPKNGWCLRRMRSDLINQNDDISATAPRGRRTFSTGRRFVTRLLSDANGAANEVGTVRKGVFMRPGVLRSRTTEDGNTFRLLWRGATRRTVAFTLGAEAHWDASSDFVFSPTAEVGVRLQRNC